MQSKIFVVVSILLFLSPFAGIAFGATELEIGNNFEAHYALAHRYIARADFDLAELELTQALTSKPQSRKAHRDYIFTSLMHLNFAQALAEFMITIGMGKAIPLTAEEQQQLDRDTAKLHYRKALKYSEQNRLDKEIFELRWANHYLPNNATIMRSLAFALANSGENAQAEKLYKDSFILVTKPSTEDAYAHADYAYMLGKMSQQNEAISELRKAIAIDPKSSALHVDMTWFLEAKGDLVGATREIEKAIDLAPHHVVGTVDIPTSTIEIFGFKMLTHHQGQPIYSGAGLWTKLGQLLERQKKFAAAKKAYESALQLNPQDQDIKVKLSELKI